MRPAVSFALCLLGIALVQAVPANIKDKSLIEDAEAASNINLEETGSEKDRAKKSAASFCVEIRPGSTQATQQAQSAQMVVAPQPLSFVQPAVQQVVQPAVQQVVQPASQQTFSIVPAAQPVQQPAQPVHTLHIMQPAPQPCVQPQTYSIVQSQPAPQPTATLNIVQPQPAPQPSATLNIVQPAPKPEPKPLAEPVVVPAPQEKFERIVEVVKPEPEHQKPTQVVNIIQPAQPMQEHHEAVNMMPMEPACEEKVVMVPKPIMIMPEPQPKPLAAIVEVPTMTQQCHHHALRTECTCRPKSLHSAALKERSMYPISMSPSLSSHHRLEPMMFAGQPRTPTFLLNRSIRSDKEAETTE